MNGPVPMSVDADDRARFARQNLAQSNEPAMMKGEVYRAHEPQTTGQKIISKATNQPINQSTYQSDYDLNSAQYNPELRSAEREYTGPLFGSNGPAMSKGEVYSAHRPANSAESVISKSTHQPINRPTYDDDFTSQSMTDKLVDKFDHAKEVLSEKVHSVERHGRADYNRSAQELRNKDESLVMSSDIPVRKDAQPRRKSWIDSLSGMFVHDVADDYSQPFNTGNNSGPHPQPEPSKNPLADSMRDAHLHKGPIGLPTHASKMPIHDNTSIHPKVAKQVHEINHSVFPKRRSVDYVEPKDESASSPGRLMRTLYSLHEKLEAGVQVIRDKADDFAEKNLRSSPTPDNEKKLLDSRGNIPTLMDQYNQKVGD